MTREDCIWVAIRVFGIYLVVLCVLAIPPLLSGVFMIYDFPSIAGDGELAALQDKLRRTFVSNTMRACLRFVICGSIGWYFLTRGTLMFKIISRRQPGPRDDGGTDVSTDGQQAD